MKAIHLMAYGNPAQNLRMVDVAEPNAPSAGEALVRMEYAPVGYSDLLLANGVYLPGYWRVALGSIAVTRGRARGGGSEFTLACDIRF